MRKCNVKQIYYEKKDGQLIVAVEVEKVSVVAVLMVVVYTDCAHSTKIYK